MSKKKEAKWMQVGNYLLGVEENSLGKALCAKSVSGNWSLRWREDNLMFAVVLNMLGDEKCHSYVESLLTLCYAATNYPHDLVSIIERQETPVMNGFAKLVKEQAEFEASVAKQPTKEQDAEALKEVVEMQEVQDELERMDEEEVATRSQQTEREDGKEQAEQERDEEV